jgi:hypothetical protein
MAMEGRNCFVTSKENRKLYSEAKGKWKEQSIYAKLPVDLNRW